MRSPAFVAPCNLSFHPPRRSQSGRRTFGIFRRLFSSCGRKVEWVAKKCPGQKHGLFSRGTFCKNASLHRSRVSDCFLVWLSLIVRPICG